MYKISDYSNPFLNFSILVINKQAPPTDMKNIDHYLSIIVREINNNNA